jgi:hypothetical protein
MFSENKNFYTVDQYNRNNNHLLGLRGGRGTQIVFTRLHLEITPRAADFQGASA